MRNGLFREKSRKGLPSEDLRRTCEETDRAGQARIDELSMHHKRGPTVSQLWT